MYLKSTARMQGVGQAPRLSSADASSAERSPGEAPGGTAEAAVLPVFISSYDEITQTRPEKGLGYTRKKTGGRNVYGRVTSRGRGQGHKQKVRTVDFKRNKFGMEAKVVAIEYDPIRSARLALIEYKDGERRYIIAPVGLQVGASLKSGATAEPEVGNALPLKTIPVGLTVHNIEMIPGKG